MRDYIENPGFGIYNKEDDLIPYHPPKEGFKNIDEDVMIELLDIKLKNRRFLIKNPKNRLPKENRLPPKYLPVKW